MILHGSFEAGCPVLTLQLEGEAKPRLSILDTGFNGELMVPQSLATALGWVPIGVVDCQTASGVTTTTLVEGRISWFGVSRRVSAMTTDADILLVGMELLHDCELRIRRDLAIVQVSRG